MGSCTVTKDDFAAPEAGFVLYNITDGIMATDVAACFKRWLTFSPLTYTATTIRLKTDGQPRPTVEKPTSIAIG
ncbi:uncharacterized protein N7529_000285 [Penicillium soppii]|jgi:hypothetical protein|uniref:uncharacterized protein n=1 Tax=Penicillium soppii TaxID=69789 RepID=UPI0025485FEF|nr:uncharacterized protein N7529_000285 [Penicillium soppii]KAJ5881613.1 hypothetical protein N7529_000285 [Penicillium soppii]